MSPIPPQSNQSLHRATDPHTPKLLHAGRHCCVQAQVDAGGFSLGYAVATYQVGGWLCTWAH